MSISRRQGRGARPRGRVGFGQERHDVLGAAPCRPPGRIVDGTVRFDGLDVLAMPKKQLRDIRGDRVTMVFQQPNSSLNPCYRAGDQIGEVYDVHEQARRSEREERAIEMLAKVGIPDPGRGPDRSRTSSRVAWPSG